MFMGQCVSGPKGPLLVLLAFAFIFEYEIWVNGTLAYEESVRKLNKIKYTMQETM